MCVSSGSNIGKGREKEHVNMAMLGFNDATEHTRWSEIVSLLIAFVKAKNSTGGCPK